MSLRPHTKRTRDLILERAIQPGADALALCYPTSGPDATESAGEKWARQVRHARHVIAWLVMFAGGVFALRVIDAVPTPYLLAVALVVALWRAFSAELFLVRSAGVAWAVALVCAAVVTAAVNRPSDFATAHALVFVPAVALVGVAAYVGAHQVVFLRLADLRLTQAVRDEYTRRWGCVLAFTRRGVPPEAKAFRRGVLAVAVAAAVSLAWTASGEGPAAGLIGVAVFLIACLGGWLLLVAPERPVAVVRASWEAVVLFLGYNLHRTIAPGVFHFPTRRLRNVDSRVLLVSVCVAVTAAGTSGLVYREPSRLIAATIRFVRYDAAPSGVAPPVELYDPLAAGQKAARQYTADRDRYLVARNAEIWARFDAAGDALLAEVERLAVALALCVTLPLAVGFAVVVTTVGVPLAAYADVARRQPAASAFEQAVRRVQFSHDPAERRSLFLGHSLYGDYGILLDWELFRLHGLVRGKPRSGKTAFLERMMFQLLAANGPERVAWLHANGIPHRPTTLVVFDMKGENRQLQSTRELCERYRIPLKVFSFEPNTRTHLFNFFTQSRLDEISTNHFVDVLMKGLGTTYGQAYGMAFFGSQNQIVAANVFRERYDLDTFHKLHEFLKSKEGYDGLPKQIDNAQHFYAVVQYLSSIHAINVGAEEGKAVPEAWEHQIDIPSLVGGPCQVVYFHLPVSKGETEAVAVAKLATFCLFSAVNSRRPGEDNQIVAVYDEFHEVIGGTNLQSIIAMAASKNLSLVFSHQHREQLREVRGKDMREIVEACAQWSVYFDFDDESTMEHILRLSAEGTFSAVRWEEELAGRDPDADGAFYPTDGVAGGRATKIGLSEVIRPVLEKNDLIEWSATPNVALARLSKCVGHSVCPYFTPIIWEHYWSAEEARRLDEAPWPGHLPGMLLTDLDYAGGAQADAPRAVDPAAIAALEERMKRPPVAN
jgi:hypothetical protein